MGLKEIKGDWREDDGAVPERGEKSLYQLKKQGGQQQAWTTGAVKGKSKEEKEEKEVEKTQKENTQKKRNGKKEKPKNGHKPICLSIF